MPEKKSAAEELVEILAEEAEQACADFLGGYPSDFGIIRGHVIVASVDHDEAPVLTIYPPQVVRRWLRRIRAYQKKYPEDSLSDAVGETEE